MPLWLLFLSIATAYVSPECLEAIEQLNRTYDDADELADDYFECVERKILGPLDPECLDVRQQFNAVNRQIPNLIREKDAACRPRVS